MNINKCQLFKKYINTSGTNGINKAIAIKYHDLIDNLRSICS